MNVGVSRPRDPRATPEHVLWALRKMGRTLEARTRMTPLGPELSLFVDGELLWSLVLRDGRDVGELFEEGRRVLEAKRWVGAEGARQDGD